MQNFSGCYIIIQQSGITHNWVWRSLVARLNGVQEAGSSNLLTQTTNEAQRKLCFFLCQGKKTMTRRYAIRALRNNVRKTDCPAIAITRVYHALQIFSPRPRTKHNGSCAFFFVRISLLTLNYPAPAQTPRQINCIFKIKKQRYLPLLLIDRFDCQSFFLMPVWVSV